jgi:NAD(P)-dependent dehydrogenase (short-subunit alcohol dehydrogenase family)
MGIAIVTGANRGIGLEIVRQLHARGTAVAAVCRQASAALEQIGVRVERGVDLTRPDAPGEISARFAGDTVDLLVNNAGILLEDGLEDFRADDVRAQFEVNALAPLLVTRALLPRLAPDAKIALITSRMGSMGDNGSGGYYGYRMSKAALNAAGVSLARDLKPRGIAVAILHPGAVRTGMTGGHGAIEADEAARGLLRRIDELTVETSGLFQHQSGEILPW